MYTFIKCSTVYFTCCIISFNRTAPTIQVSNVIAKRVSNNNRAARVSWTPLTPHEARGFPVYFVTYQRSSQVGRVASAINTVNTTDSSVVIDTLDPTMEYTFTVDVGTAGGKLRSTLAPGQCMLLECMDCHRRIA